MIYLIRLDEILPQMLEINFGKSNPVHIKGIFSFGESFASQLGYLLSELETNQGVVRLKSF